MPWSSSPRSSEPGSAQASPPSHCEFTTGVVLLGSVGVHLTLSQEVNVVAGSRPCPAAHTRKFTIESSHQATHALPLCQRPSILCQCLLTACVAIRSAMWLGGMVFGLYEAFITKVLFRPTFPGFPGCALPTSLNGTTAGQNHSNSSLYGAAHAATAATARGLYCDALANRTEFGPLDGFPVHGHPSHILPAVCSLFHHPCAAPARAGFHRESRSQPPRTCRCTTTQLAGSTSQGSPCRNSRRCGHLTTWTVLQQDGPNHLGLLYNVLPGHQMALITSDCAPFQLVFYYHPLWSFLIPCLVCERLLCAPVDGRCEPAPAPARCISLWTQSFLFGNSIALQ